MQVTMKRDDVMAKLKERLAAAKAEDAKIEKAHKVGEQAALKKFHEDCRTAMKWTYEQAKKKWGGPRIKQPSCPMREANAIEAAIHMVEFSTSPRFTVREGSDLHRALTWLPAAKRAAKTVCG